MKKFNTILAIAAVALSSVFGLSSCEKNDDAFSQSTAPMDQTIDTGIITKEQTPSNSSNTYNYNLFVNDDVLNLGDVVVTLEQDGQSQEYRLSEAQSVTKTIEVQVFTEKVQRTFCGKMLVINNVKSGAVVTPVFEGNADALATLQQDGKTDVAIFPYYIENLTTGGTHVDKNEQAIPGLMNVKVLEFINKRINLCIHTF